MRKDPHALVGAYAADALSDRERSRFETHLARCPSCSEEVRGFRETAARLANVAASAPPAELKHSTLTAAAHTRQLPPANPSTAHLPSARTTAAHVARAVHTWRTTRPTWIATLAWGLIVLLVSGGIITGVAERSAQHRLHQTQSNDALIEAVLTAPDATILSARVATGGSAHVIMSPSKHALVFSAAALTPLKHQNGYQLWLIRRGLDEPAGTVPQGNQGRIGPVVMRGIQAGDSLGLNVEPRPGTRNPTTPMILELAL